MDVGSRPSNAPEQPEETKFKSSPNQGTSFHSCKEVASLLNQGSSKAVHFKVADRGASAMSLLVPNSLTKNI